MEAIVPNYIASAPLVGAHFHPPAKLLLQHLRNGTPLRLEREPENPYDSNAIGVWIDILSDYDLQLDEGALAGYGLDIDEVVNGHWQLGHVAAKTGEAASLAPLLDAGEQPVATLSFDMKGAPIVRLQWA
jgi:hypothetical protein